MLFILVLSVIAVMGCRAMEPFSIGIRDSVMMCHSFKGKEFGPAQNLHGATFTVDVDFLGDRLQDKCNWVIDMDKAKEIIHNVLARYHMKVTACASLTKSTHHVNSIIILHYYCYCHKNLDDLYPEENTTTEFMCHEIHSDICQMLKDREHFKGALRVKL